MTSQPEDLPIELCAIRDAAVAHVATGAALPKNIEALMSWFEIEGVCTHDFLVLDIGAVADQYFNDIEIKGKEGLPEDYVLSDDERIEVSRSIIDHEIVSGNCACLVVGFDIVREDGVSAIFFCEGRLAGQLGAIYSFAGVYKNTEQIKESYLKSGFLVDPDAGEISSEKILQLWRHPTPRRSKPRRNAAKPR